jgi:hypothetical protein
VLFSTWNNRGKFFFTVPGKSCYVLANVFAGLGRALLRGIKTIQKHLRIRNEKRSFRSVGIKENGIEKIVIKQGTFPSF